MWEVSYQKRTLQYPSSSVSARKSESDQADDLAIQGQPSPEVKMSDHGHSVPIQCV